MSLIGLILMIFLGIRLIVAFVNFLSLPYLPKVGEADDVLDISILIPARNEESNIAQLLHALIQFEKQPLEILVYDDGSTDSTAHIVESFEQKYPHVKLIRGSELPSGWLGKNHACHQLAKQAKGRYLLFLDADVSVKDGLLPRVLRYVRSHNLDLLSMFPQQQMGSLGEKVTVPLMNWSLLSLLPLPLVRLSNNPAFAAANGQFMLFKADVYQKLRPHEQFKSHSVEDIAICRFYKKQGFSAATLLGDEHIACRMYRGLDDAVNGFSKNVFEFFGGSIFVTLFFAVLTTFTPVILFWLDGLIAGLISLFAIVIIRIFVSLASKQSMIENLVLLIPQQFMFLIIIGHALKTHHKKELLWKGRNILQS